MGKRKVKNWRPKKPERKAPGIDYALTMANYQRDREKEIRENKAVQKVVNDLQEQWTDGVVNWFYGLLALALHDEGWGAKRILRVVERIRDYHKEYNDPDFGDFDLWQVVQDEVGLELVPGDLRMQKWEERKHEQARGN